MSRDEAIELGKRYFQKNPKEMVSLYKELYGETICQYCKGVIAAAFETVVRLRNNPICKYKLKPGGKISNANGYWTNFNLTDEVAEKLISEGYQKMFA